MRQGVVGVVGGVAKTVYQCQWCCCPCFWYECVDSVRCAYGIALCDPPGVLVAR